MLCCIRNNSNADTLADSPALINLARMGDQMRREIYLLQIFLDLNVEEEYIPIAQAFQALLRKWRRTEKELCEKRENMVKCQSELNTLEVKLLHARNQVSVEMKRRQNAETMMENLERQLMLVRDLLVSGDAAIAPLNNSMIALFGKLDTTTAANADRRRLQTMGHSSSSSLSNLSHSDISYDKTEDFVEEEPVVKSMTAKPPREKRRSSLVPRISQPVPVKRLRQSQIAATTPENVIEPVVSKTALVNSDSWNPTPSSSAVQPLPRRRSRQSQLFAALGQTSIWRSIEDETLPQIDETELEPEPPAPEQNQFAPPKKHIFITKTVILVESCAVCGKRVRFGKMSLKCRDCRLLIHPECKDICSKVCIPGSVVLPLKSGQWCLADFAPSTPPRIPALVIQCVNEIELRGLSEKGIYRVSGCDRQVKDLKMKFLRSRGPLPLSRVDDIHAVCGLLKDFLRNLKEPIVTFQLHPHFMDAADILNEEDSKSEMCQVVLKLPPANRDTLAYLVLHLQRVIRSTHCNMDRNNLARVFGPTLVGHSISEPNPLMIMQDTPRQAKVVSRLLSVHAPFWDKFVTEGQENIQHAVVESNTENLGMSTEKGRLFVPLTSPEINSQVMSSSNLQKKGKTGLGTPFVVNQPMPKNKGEPIKKQRFFTSPNV